MTALPASGFDNVAHVYQELWTGTHIGRLQREAVWRHCSDLFPAGSQVLDLGCGPGDDACFLATRGVRVKGIDASPEMIRIARSRGVDALLCPIENLASLHGCYEGAISDFGAINCVERLDDLCAPLARLIRPGGHLAFCVMNRVCLWETVWFSLQGRFRSALRRWSGEAASSLAPRVFYPTLMAICRAFAPAFTLLESHGIGVAVPPSCVTGVSGDMLNRLGILDEHIASWPVFRALGDHRLLILQRDQEL
jgi:SAM-dependent methyltransferase